MKRLPAAIYLLAVLFVLVSCQHAAHQPSGPANDKVLASTGTFGEQITPEGAIPVTEVISLFSQADNIKTKLTGKITSSCKHSGCWMEVAIDSALAIHVTFDQESFTIPLDAAGKNAVFQGTAYRSQIPVEILQDYAREGGKTDKEIAAITEPAWEYEFVATGVIITD